MSDSLTLEFFYENFVKNNEKRPEIELEMFDGCVSTYEYEEYEYEEYGV